MKTMTLNTMLYDHINVDIETMSLNDFRKLCNDICDANDDDNNFPMKIMTLNTMLYDHVNDGVETMSLDDFRKLCNDICDSYSELCDANDDDTTYSTNSKDPLNK